jgi:eukaryotic-like serine/threonine-protein kinase
MMSLLAKSSDSVIWNYANTGTMQTNVQLVVENGHGGDFYVQAADGSSPLERLTTSEYYHHPSSISPDGKTLAFIESTPGAGGLGHRIMLLDLSSRQIKPLMNSKFTERAPEFSPDGRWLAYTTNESGRFEIYVQPYPGPGSRRQLTEAGGSDPLWSRNGKQLFYR